MRHFIVGRLLSQSVRIVGIVRVVGRVRRVRRVGRVGRVRSVRKVRRGGGMEASAVRSSALCYLK